MVVDCAWSFSIYIMFAELAGHDGTRSLGACPPAALPAAADKPSRYVVSAKEQALESLIAYPDELRQT